MGTAKNYEYVTYEEFEEMQRLEEKFKLEYDNGFVHYMSPVYPNHERVKNAIAHKIISSIGLKGPCEVFTSEVAVVFESNTEKHEFEPDIMICCDSSKFEKAKYKATPTLIVEILSRATKDRDTGSKFEVYQSFAVPEYWIVDINELTITVFNKNVKGIYTSMNIYTPESQFVSFNKIEFKVDEIFDVLK